MTLFLLCHIMDVASYARAVRFNESFDFASLAVLVYDYLLTLPWEVRYIWNSPWNLGKVLFLVNRYQPLLDVPMDMYLKLGTLPSESVCTGLNGWVVMSFIVGILVSEAILALRTWAVWSSTRPWGTVLSLTLALVAIINLTLGSITLKGILIAPVPIPGFSGCILVGTSDNNITASTVFIIFTVYEAGIFIATMMKGLHHLRQRSPLLLATLYRDAFMFTTILFVISFLNVVFERALPTNTSNLLFAPERVAHSVLSGRILLHLREANSRSSSADFETQESAHVENSFELDTRHTQSITKEGSA